jgi:nucleoside-diphosphate-sugar epimerase
MCAKCRVTSVIRKPCALFFEKPVQDFFHLAATLTAEAERDFAKGLAVNTVGLLELLDECRCAGVQRFVFSSSMAAFGGALPDVVPDDIQQRPTTSYGVQKVIAELLLDDYTRRGFMDGRALRLPVVLLRPRGSAPALSEHISAFVREPLEGRHAVCPFALAMRMPVASVGAVARALIKLYEMPSDALGAVRTINLPGLSVTVEDMVAAMARKAKPGAADLITWKADAALQGLLDAMPKGFTSARALRAGILPESGFDDVIDDFLAHVGG